MLQRNDTGSSLVLPTIDPPAEVPPGGVIDHDTLLAGFTPVDEPKPASDKPPTSKSATTDTSATGEEVAK